MDPFDREFLSQELRDAWKKIEQLEKENKELKNKLNQYEIKVNDSSWNKPEPLRHEMGG